MITKGIQVTATTSDQIPRVRQPYSAYHRARDFAEDPELTHVGRGTPGGEYLRRTWQPVCLSSELADLPIVVRMLGEDLVVFRTTAGDVAVMERHCSHRGASLEYGLPSDKGIVCCYHGWHYACDGTILDTPNDPDSTIKERICHPAYPAHEYNGLIFAWMGPPEEIPDFPILDFYRQHDTEIIPFSLHFPCNWVQVLDNTQDPTHSCFLHTRVSGAQFSISWGELPELDYLATPIGMINLNVRRWKDKVWVRTTDMMLPNINQTGALWLTADEDETFLRASLSRWMRPIDDANTQMIGWRFFNDRNDPDGVGVKEDIGLGKIDFIGQTEDERPYEERQRIPGDFEAIVGQRPIAVHGLENHNTGDRGVALMRRIIRENIRAVAAGEDFLTLERAKKVAGVVPTYTQDTVLTIPPKDDDRALMREVGRQVNDVVFEGADRPDADRERDFAARLKEIVAAHT